MTTPDPHRLLTGTGKVHRHVVLSKAEDLERTGLKELLLAASTRVPNATRIRTTRQTLTIP